MSLRSLLQGVRRRRNDDSGDIDSVDTTTVSTARPKVLVDSNTRTFWAQGSTSATTLVEAEIDITGYHSASQKVAALVAAHDDLNGGRPRSSPAYAEAVFVELMRAQRYDRAFDLLAPDCQRRWGSAQAFALAHGGRAMSQLLGVEVISVRHLQGWTDPATGRVHDYVAELDVEYAMGSRDQRTDVARTVHLVPCNGQWRSLSYP